MISHFLQKLFAIGYLALLVLLLFAALLALIWAELLILGVGVASHLLTSPQFWLISLGYGMHNLFVIQSVKESQFSQNYLSEIRSVFQFIFHS